MPTLKHIFSPFLCCFSIHSPEEHTTSDLQTLPSALSVQLSASQVPHAAIRSGSKTADTEALRELFRTSSSIRGYRTASLPSGSNLQREPSFDADFKFGQQEQQRKQPSRLEQLGIHIKQKLSESGLSKSGSKSHITSEDGGHNSARNDNTNLGISAPEAGLSQRSTGLLELLMSRTTSEGGYDSDARSIQTAMLKSREGTMKMSPQRARTLLSRPADLHHTATDGAPSSPRSSQHDASVVCSRSEPAPLSSHPSKPSFTEVLQQLNAEGVNDTVKLPEAFTPGTLPAFAALETKEQDPFTTSPPNTCPLSDNKDTGFAVLLKKLGDTANVSKRDSLISSLTDPRTSLVSNLDPSLLDFISKYGERASAEIAIRPLDDNVAQVIVESDSQVVDSQPVVGPSMSATRETSKRDLASLTESDRSSVHLYNMRISQRLASPSFVAAPSRPNTCNKTTQVLRQNSGGRPSSSQMSMSGKIAGLTKAEHNRRPSDPQTRRLFEGDMATPRLLSARRPGTSPEGDVTIRKPKPLVNTDDASSFYWSDGEFDHDGPSRHRHFKRNPNSIAIGGRSESISLPIGFSSDSIGNLSVAGESAWFSRKSSQQRRGFEPDSPLHQSAKRNRSVSAPDGNNLGPRGLTTIPARRFQHPTEADETMSEINVDQLQDARKEQLTEISAQAIRDARNERMSEVEPFERGYATDTRQNLKAFWSHAGPSMTAPRLSVCERRSKSDNEDGTTSVYNGKPGFQESATNIWRRTFKRALEEPEEDSLGGFPTSPRFDRDGRRRSTRSSTSTVQPPQDHRGSDADVDPLETGARHEQSKLKKKPHIGACMQKPDPLPSVNPRQSLAIIDARNEAFDTLGGPKNSRKKSLLDIGRRFTVVGMSSEAERGSGAITPLKDLLGLWGRFPSHTREDGCGSAGPKDGVAVRDFALECQDENTPSSTAPQTRSTTALGLHTPGSWKILSFGKKDRVTKRKTKSASQLQTIQATQSLGGRPKKSRKGVTGRWKKLYRSSSTDFRAYTHTYGHQSSISVGASVEYPELEVVPGIEYRGWRSDVDGTTETDRRHQREVANRSQDHLRLETPLDTATWTQMYRDCVGSLSALKSDPELRRMSLDGGSGQVHHGDTTIGGLSSGELRDSTVNFESQLGKENEAAREGLIHKVESMQEVQA